MLNTLCECRGGADISRSGLYRFDGTGGDTVADAYEIISRFGIIVLTVILSLRVSDPFAGSDTVENDAPV